eukprot:6214681-Pleurochrysis_carterae.AAC.7
MHGGAVAGSLGSSRRPPDSTAWPSAPPADSLAGVLAEALAGVRGGTVLSRAPTCTRLDAVFEALIRATLHPPLFPPFSGSLPMTGGCVSAVASGVHACATAVRPHPAPAE